MVDLRAIKQKLKVAIAQVNWHSSGFGGVQPRQQEGVGAQRPAIPQLPLGWEASGPSSERQQPEVPREEGDDPLRGR